MSGRFVRASKYRHVFGRSARKEQCYDNLRISRNAWDTNLVKANPLFLAVNWEASGGGAFAVIPLHEKGKLPEHIPLFRGHTAVVLDTDWSPFDDHLIASASDDAKVFLWKVPEDFAIRSEDEELEDVSPVNKLTGHSRKVGHVLFNPAAENVLATTSGDYTVKIWDVERGAAALTLKQGDIVQSLSWSANGSLLVTTSRDKKLRVWDVRQEKAAQEVPGHSGAKNSRAVWMGEHDRVATTGFSKMSDRQLGLWDIRNAREPIGGFQTLDSISGVCMPFWDDGTQCLYLAGKGDGNIRYFEYQNDKFEYLSEYKSADPQRGIGFLPKRAVNLHENEVMRAFKTVNDSYIEPISFIVPRRAEVFQDDIFPPAVGSEPGVSAKEWFEGKDGLPPKIDLGSIFDGQEPTVVPAAPKPSAAANMEQQPSSPVKETRKEESAPAPAPAAAQRVLPRSINETKDSIAQMASKFADKKDDDDDDDEEDEDDSTFDEPPSQSQRIIQVPTKAEPSKSVPTNESVPAKDLVNQTAPQSSATKAAEPAKNAAHGALSEIQTEKPKPSSNANGATSPTKGAPKSDPSSNTIPIHSSLQHITTLLEQQNRTIAAQTDRISQLTVEVDTLKTQMMSSSSDSRSSLVDKDEQIRELQRQLEESQRS